MKRFPSARVPGCPIISMCVSTLTMTCVIDISIKQLLNKNKNHNIILSVIMTDGFPHASPTLSCWVA